MHFAKVKAPLYQLLYGVENWIEMRIYEEALICIKKNKEMRTKSEEEFPG